MFSHKDETYFNRIVGVIEYAKKLDPQAPGAAISDFTTPRCPECGQVPTGRDTSLHRMHDEIVIIACEGYYVIDPELVGMGSGNWMDFRVDIEDFDFWKETGIND